MTRNTKSPSEVYRKLMKRSTWWDLIPIHKSPRQCSTEVDLARWLSRSGCLTPHNESLMSTVRPQEPIQGGRRKHPTRLTSDSHSTPRCSQPHPLMYKTTEEQKKHHTQIKLIYKTFTTNTILWMKYCTHAPAVKQKCLLTLIFSEINQQAN